MLIVIQSILLLPPYGYPFNRHGQPLDLTYFFTFGALYVTASCGVSYS